MASENPREIQRSKGLCVVYIIFIRSFICYKMNAILQILFGYLTLRNLLLYTGLPVATWLFYKASIEPFISPISKVISAVNFIHVSICFCRITNWGHMKIRGRYFTKLNR